MPIDDSDDEVRHVNRLDATGTGDVVQARDVHGGVHIHHAETAFAVTPSQLPGDVRGFVNRHTELALLTSVAGDQPDDPHAAAVTVISGTAGVGKTSLALHWAHRVRDRFPDGQLYVNLRGYDPGQPAVPEEVLDRFLRDLGVPATAIPVHLDERASLYRSLLATRRMLVVLDNAATAGQIRPLLPGTASCLVLVTSRSRLSGLVARDGAYRLGLDILLEEDAIALLGAVTARYRGHDQRQELVELARLCARLPLALRIAAERAASRPMMRLDELIADLRDESGLWDALTAEGDDDADAVRTVFAWSYRALPEPAARLFRLLGLHPGNEFGLPATAALAGISAPHARQQLDVLIGAHLLEQPAPGRYEFPRPAPRLRRRPGPPPRNRRDTQPARKFGLADLRVLRPHLRGKFPGLRDRPANTADGGLLRSVPGRRQARCPSRLGRVEPPAGRCLRCGIRLVGARCRVATAASDDLHHEDERDRRPRRDAPGDHGWLGGQHVGQDRRGYTSPERQPRRPSVAPPVAERDGCDCHHAVYRDRQQVGNQLRLAVLQSNSPHMGVRRERRDSSHQNRPGKRGETTRRHAAPPSGGAESLALSPSRRALNSAIMRSTRMARSSSSAQISRTRAARTR